VSWQLLATFASSPGQSRSSWRLVAQEEAEDNLSYTARRALELYRDEDQVWAMWERRAREIHSSQPGQQPAVRNGRKSRGSRCLPMRRIDTLTDAQWCQSNGRGWRARVVSRVRFAAG